MILTDKNSPKTFDEVVLAEKIKTYFKEILNNPFEKFIGMTLAGPPGIGKTTIAKVFAQLLGGPTLWLNASDENDANTIRNRVSDFCNSAVESGKLKLVVLDEADCLTNKVGQGAGAQDILRGLIEESSSDTRFILTCNYVNRISPALLSRCPLINLEFEPKDVMARVIQILKSEQIKCKKTDVELFYNAVVKRKFPQIRDILHTLSMSIDENNVLDSARFSINSSTGNVLDEFAKDIIKRISEIKSDSDCKALSQYYMDNVDKFAEDYELLSKQMFWQLMNEPQKQIIIAEYMNRMKNQFDKGMKEVQFYAMCLELRN